MPGEVGNVVVAGHRVSHNKDFRNLDQLVPGDEVIMSTMTRALTCTTSSAPRSSGPTRCGSSTRPPARTATLFACHPPGSTSQRIVVHLELA